MIVKSDRRIFCTARAVFHVERRRTNFFGVRVKKTWDVQDAALAVVVAVAAPKRDMWNSSELFPFFARRKTSWMIRWRRRWFARSLKREVVSRLSNAETHIPHNSLGFCRSCRCRCRLHRHLRRLDLPFFVPLSLSLKVAAPAVKIRCSASGDDDFAVRCRIRKYICLYSCWPTSVQQNFPA